MGSGKESRAHLLGSHQLNLQVSDDRLVLVLPLRQLFAGGLQLCEPALQLLAAPAVGALQLVAQLLALLLESALQLKEDTSRDGVRPASAADWSSGGARGQLASEAFSLSDCIS